MRHEEFYSSLMRSFIALLLIALGASTEAASELRAQDCHRDHETMLKGIAQLRASAVAQINEALAEVANETERSVLIAERERAWDEEERHRSLAHQALRDCLRHVSHRNAQAKTAEPDVTD